MRPLVPLMGLVWFLLFTAAAYGVTGMFTRRPRVQIQRQALPPTPQPVPQPTVPAPASLPVPEREELPEPAYQEPPELPAEPVDLPVPAPERPRGPRVEIAPMPTFPAAPGQPAPEPEPAAEAPDDGMGRCLVCGASTPSWVEVDGRRQGYCAKHQSRLKVSAPRSAPAPAVDGTDEPPAAGSAPGSASSEGGSAQCMGVTRSGTRCRRKTRDPSGFCYQHRR